MKVLVVPDIHLKTYMFDMAEKYAKNADITVFLGDIIDDFGKQNNLGLYEETLNRLVEYVKTHPTYFCYGNHDIQYLHNNLFCTGYSDLARPVVQRGFTELRRAFGLEADFKIRYIHRIDNVIFSHAGVIQYFLMRNIYGANNLEDPEEMDRVLEKLNMLPINSYWENDSPIWARPGMSYYINHGYLQVVGHTPVQKIEQRENTVLTDVFSTYTNGMSYGEEKMIIVDTLTKEYEYAKG